ncbi:MAG: hypothetical protein KZQ89_08595 [Candidatus Thiodiazotropha sp. (ex Lucinoma kastoroae)]|nr:hypothetical protein [Candidatus Thiodiazotropha sp. (ex Lucinoma kastoroae)]MCU7859270.1 hypothetical protein [Candidatus Thiodiazotropha sp. (ex Lucinoma kastoroae)]
MPVYFPFMLYSQFLQRYPSHIVMGLLVTLFTSVTMVIAYRYNQSMATTIQFGEEKQWLVNEVSATNDRLQKEVEKYKCAEAARSESQETVARFWIIRSMRSISSMQRR